MPRADLDALCDLDRAHLIHPITEFRKHETKGPRVVVGGEGIHVELADGRRLIDGLSGLFNINVGHGRREIADAVAQQMHEFAYYPAFWDFSSESAIRLAERIVGLLPEDRRLRHLLFTTGGSDANEAAFRVVRMYQAARGRPERSKILSRRHAFHGITRAAGSATRIPAYHALASVDPAHVECAAPYCFRCEFGEEPSSCDMPCVADVEQTIEREGADTIAAMIVEPVMGTGGIILPPPGYFARLQEVCRRHEILLIFDEVITGFGRTGAWFGMEHWDARPDVMAFAKGITSGYLPLGGIAFTDHVYETIRDQSPRGLPFMFGLTYNNHPSCCAAALANLDIVEREGLVTNARVVGDHLRKRLSEGLASHPLVADVRGIGMMLAIECAEPGSKEPVGGKPMAFPAQVAARCYERDLIVRALWENVALAPPLCTTQAEADQIADIVLHAFQSTHPG
ncbi:MAG: aspartate aminotransferase family protein [Deltaproteobacteria bacterium]|nr:aspartate aminotransferase family protein [Deltaproteobacteria bacterium]MBW2446666.1 aspartate aminotransferase family protein [Deltaproteobacteria bacterium]